MCFLIFANWSMTKLRYQNGWSRNGVIYNIKTLHLIQISPGFLSLWLVLISSLMGIISRLLPIIYQGNNLLWSLLIQLEKHNVGWGQRWPKENHELMEYCALFCFTMSPLDLKNPHVTSWFPGLHTVLKHWLGVLTFPDFQQNMNKGKES